MSGLWVLGALALSAAIAGLFLLDGYGLLISDARRCWRFWSLRLGVIGTVLTTALLSFPDFALTVWNVMPEEVKDLLPERLVPLLGVAVFGAAMVARVIRQKDRDDER